MSTFHAHGLKFIQDLYPNQRQNKTKINFEDFFTMHYEVEKKITAM